MCGQIQRLERGRRATENQPRPLELRAHRGGIAGVVARRRALLVAGLVLFVHDNGAQALHRREYRRAGADGDQPLTPAQRAPRVRALAIGEAGVQHRHLVSKHSAHPGHGLRRQRDFRNEQNGPVPRLHDCTKHVEIHERLA